MNSQSPRTPLLPINPGLERLKEYVALPMCWGIAGPLEDPAVKLADPLPVPWTSQFRPAAGAAPVLAAKARPTATTSRRASIGFTERDVIGVLLSPSDSSQRCATPKP